MDLLFDRLATVDVTVTTPDNSATARLRGRSSVSVSLVPGYFGTATPKRLADNLAALGELLWQAREDAVRRSGSEASQPVGVAPTSSSRDVTLRRARDSIVCEGRSADGSVSVGTVGMTAWIADLEPAAYTRGEEAFCAAAGEAISAVLADRLPQLHRLATLARADRLIA